MLQRQIFDEIKQWATNPTRKPLILRGARQVGKSFLVANLLRPLFENILEINLEKERSLHRCFEGDLSASYILSTLQALKGVKLSATTLLFIDEIQAFPPAITALRYLYEGAPHIPVIAAGSLLEFALEQVGVPVGRVQFASITPLTFEEFLLNSDQSLFLEALQSHDFRTPFPIPLHEKGLALVHEYLGVGGMPEACAQYLKDRDIATTETILSSLITGYRNDFPRYALCSSSQTHRESPSSRLFIR